MFSVPEHVKLHLALAILQCGYAGNQILTRVALNVGISKFVFLIYRNTIALTTLSPFAYFLEKGQRPALNASFLLQFFLLGLVGVTMVQGLFLVGMYNTTPVLSSSIDNAVPAITFLLASILGVERVNLRRKDGIAKVLGTISCTAGALVVTFYKGPAICKPQPTLNQSLKMISLGATEGRYWIFGSVCLIVRSVAYSSWTILQGSVVKRYPTRASLTSFTIFFGLLQLLAAAPFLERDPQAWIIRSPSALISVVYAGIIPSAIGFSIILWVVDRGGPVLATAYMPLQTVLVSIMATVFLREELYLGSIIGAMLIVAGLYLIVWGKREEAQRILAEPVLIRSVKKIQETSCEKPLLEPN